MANGGNKPNLAALLAPNSQLSGQDLRRAARALTRMQLLPQIHGYRNLVQSLRGQEQVQTRGLQRLGHQTVHQTGQAYHSLAQADAASQARQAALTKMVGNQLTDYQTGQAAQQASPQSAEVASQLQSLSMRGAPGGGIAQQQLAAMVNSQQQQSQAEALAQQKLNASQSQGYGALLTQQGMAGHAQGAASKTQIRQDVQSRIGAERAQASTDINTALGKLADTKALKGSTMIQNLMTLRKQEQDYLLGLKATRAQLHGQNVAAATSRANAQTAAQTSRHNASQSGSGSGGHTGGHARQHQINQITTLAQQAIKARGLPGGSGPHTYSRGELEHYLLQQEGISNAPLVHRILGRILHNRRHSGGGGGGPYGGAHPGIGGGHHR